MAEPRIKAVSPARAGAEGVFRHTGFDRRGTSLPLFAGEHIGVKIEVDGLKEGAVAPLSIAVFDAAGRQLTSGAEVKLGPGLQAEYDFALREADLEAPGHVVLKLEVAGGGSLQETIAYHPAARGLFGQAALGEGAGEAAIAGLQAQLGLPLCDDHLAFLRERNGVSYDWHHAPEWDASNEFYRRLSEVLEPWEAREDLPFIGELSALFGCLPGVPHRGYPERLEDLPFFDSDLALWMVPVGVGYGGNLFVQLLAGTGRGEVRFMDHEMHYGLAADIAPLAEAERARRAGGGVPGADGAIWELLEGLAALPVAESLAALVARADEMHGAVMAELVEFRR